MSGADPHADHGPEGTTQPVLGDLDAGGVKFLTLRMRSPAPVRYINALTSTDFKTITLDRPGRFNRPKCTNPPACG